MPSSGRRRLAAAFTLAVLAPSGGVVARAGDDLIACRAKGQIDVRKDGWTRIAPPPMDNGEGPREMVDFAATPRAANRLFATNGVVIKLSEDGGCTWNFLFDGAQTRVPIGGQQEPDVFTNLAAGSDDSLWAASYDDTAGVPTPHVRLFGGLGADDPQPAPPPTNINTGLPAVGKPLELLPGGMGVAYLLLEEPPDASSGDTETPTHTLYTTYTPDVPDPVANTVGLVWKEVVAPEGFGRIEGFATSPSARQVWIWSATKYATTLDAAAETASWVTRDAPGGGTITSVDVNSGGVALVTAKTGQGFQAVTADMAGKVLGRASVPILPTTMTHGSRPDVRVLSGPAGTWGYDVRLRQWIDITPKGAGTLRSLAMGYGRVERIVLAQTKDAIWRFDTFPGETFVEVDDSIFGRGYPQPPHSTITEPFIDVRPQVLTVKPGEVKDADVEFGMPPAATPLDVFFLVDTTGSMQGAINGLRKDIKSIADGLRAQLGHEACFGVGDFKDFTALDAAKVFRTHLPITPCSGDDKLTNVGTALKELGASSGGDDPEAQTIALTQMITGTGQTNPPVLAGQQARFRREAYKIAVLISDAPFKRASGYPTIEQTVHTLDVAGVKVVSVLVLTDLNPELGRADMTELAEGTGSLAPDGGVDCDGDGQKGPGDLREGDALICEANGIEPNIGPVITSLLLGVQDPGSVAVDVDDPDQVIAGEIKGLTSTIANLKRESRLPFTVPVSCSKEQDGQDLTVRFTPAVRALPVGIAGDLVVQCRSVPVVPPPILPDPVVEPDPVSRPKQPQARAIVPPPNPPVQPVTNMTLNAGFSQQEEQQFQLAAVTQGASEVEESEEIELAMTGLDRPEQSTPAGAFVVGAMTIAAAAGVAHRRRLQRSQRPAYVRSARR